MDREKWCSTKSTVSYEKLPFTRGDYLLADDTQHSRRYTQHTGVTCSCWAHPPSRIAATWDNCHVTDDRFLSNEDIVKQIVSTFLNSSEGFLSITLIGATSANSSLELPTGLRALIHGCSYRDY